MQEFGIEQQNRSGELVISLKDASAMRAYLQLLTKILNSASSSDFDSFVAALEQTVQVKPLWSLFLQLMCCPVPQVNQPPNSTSHNKDPSSAQLYYYTIYLLSL